MKVAILGVGNYTEVMIELCEELDMDIAGLYHFNNSRDGQMVAGYKILGSYDDLFNNAKKDTGVVVAIGDNKLRLNCLMRARNAGFKIPSLIHPTAYISKSASLGEANYVHPHSFVWSSAKIGDGVIISPKAMVAHHTKIANGCLISANALVGSYVTLNERVLVGIKANIISKTIVIGEDSILGANTTVIKSFPPNSKIVGTPGKNIADNSSEKSI